MEERSAPRGESMRILVVEDDKPVASFVKKGLESEQYAVDLAWDGEDAQSLVGRPTLT